MIISEQIESDRLIIRKALPTDITKLKKICDDPNTVWIGMFLIDKVYQDKSYDKEVIQTIINQYKGSNWKSIRLGVYLKNWKGIRFWNSNGFNNIVGIYGDKEYSETSFPMIVLQNELL